MIPYEYQFPFLNDNSNLELEVRPGERRVMPLYEQLWHARHVNLAFVGLPHSVVPFPLFELQAEAIVAQLLLEKDEKEGPTRCTSCQEGEETEASSSNEEEDGNARQPAKRRLLDLTARLDASQRDANVGGGQLLQGEFKMYSLFGISPVGLLAALRQICRCMG